MKKAAITIPDVDVALLKLQRDAVLESIDDSSYLCEGSDYERLLVHRQSHIERLEGVVNLLDAMIDVAMDKEEA